MTIASAWSRPLVSNRRLMISMISRVIPSRSASGSCAAYSNWLSSSRAVREDGQFANTPPKPCFASKIEIERPRVSREVWTMEKDAAGTSQPPERPVFRIGEAVIDPLSVGIEVFAFRQRQSASRLGGRHPGDALVPSITADTQLALNRNSTAEPARHKGHDVSCSYYWRSRGAGGLAQAFSASMHAAERIRKPLEEPRENFARPRSPPPRSGGRGRSSSRRAAPPEPELGSL